MTEPIEQLVVRLAGEVAWENYTRQGAASGVCSHGCAGVTLADLIAFAKACMLEQARRDVEILRGVNNYDNPMTANDAADAIDRMGIIGGRLFRTAAVLVFLAVLMWLFGVPA